MISFIVHFRPERGVDPIRALKALLKVALRRFGLRAVSAVDEGDHQHFGPATGAAGGPDHVASGDTTMQMTKYASAGFVKPEHLAGGPQTKTIADIEEGKYEKPILVFGDGKKLSLNGTNVDALIEQFGTDDGDVWIGCKIELRAGTLRYNGEDHAAVLVRALNPAPASAPAGAVRPKPQPLVPADDDEIPF